jgi:micrococcal nuclease
MGKITRFDQSRHAHYPKSAIKREIMAAADRAGSRQTYRQPVKAPGKTISGLTIFNLALLMFLGVWFLPDYFVLRPVALNQTSSTSSDNQYAQFGYCHSGGGTNCVVDGDTIWFDGEKIRIADIDTPETHPARCSEEQRLGDAATRRLQELMNAGPFSFQRIERDTDRYGRSLRIVMRGGVSVGATLVNEGLARWYGGGRQPWC